MNRYMVELKKEINSKKSFRLYIRAYSIAQLVEMLNDEYVINFVMNEMGESFPPKKGERR